MSSIEKGLQFSDWEMNDETLEYTDSTKVWSRSYSV